MSRSAFDCARSRNLTSFIELGWNDDGVLSTAQPASKNRQRKQVSPLEILRIPAKGLLPSFRVKMQCRMDQKVSFIRTADSGNFFDTLPSRHQLPRPWINYELLYQASAEFKEVPTINWPVFIQNHRGLCWTGCQLILTLKNRRSQRQLRTQKLLRINKSTLLDDTMLGVIGGFTSCPIAFGFLLHILTPFVAADFRRTSSEHRYKTKYNE